MHEMSLAESVRDIILDTVARQHAQRVVTVVLEIGELAAVELETLLFSLDIVLQASPAEGARVCVESLPGTGQCRDCGATAPMTTLYDPCPDCGSYRVRAVRGTEMRVKALEME